MMFPYAEFLIDFDRKHGGMIHCNSPENTRAAVIVETRPLFFLPKVIRNTLFFLGPSWNLHVFCGELSHDYVCESLEGWQVNIVKLPGIYRLAISDYNTLLTGRPFWDSFREDRLLLFQTDSLLTSPAVEDFRSFDYVGAPCGRFDDQYVANGGLSLRSRRVMQECVSKFRPRGGVAEDIFFTEAVRGIGAVMPDLATATRFAVESLYTAHPFGVHGTDKCFHSIEIAQRITRATQY
jgi:Protein of unknown function (DUF5672)